MTEILRRSKLFEDIDCTQNLGFRVPMLALPVPDLSLDPHCTTKAIFVISCTLLGLYDVGIGIVEFAVIEERHRQGIMDPKLLNGPV